MTDNEKPKPLSDDDLTMASDLSDALLQDADDAADASHLLASLVTEVDRLRALEIDREWAGVDEQVLAKLQAWYDASRPIVAAVASSLVVDVSPPIFQDGYESTLAHQTVNLNDIQKQARALLSKDTTQ